ncbi:MAG: hypothetical protein ABJN11_17275 [Lentilitoribacter sp.]
MVVSTQHALRVFKQTTFVVIAAGCALTLASCASKRTASNSTAPEPLAYSAQNDPNASPINAVLVEDDQDNQELVAIEPAKLADPLLNGDITPLTPVNGTQTLDDTKTAGPADDPANGIAAPSVETAPKIIEDKPTETAVTDINKTIETPIVVETPSSTASDEDELCIVTIDNDCSDALAE